MEVSVRATRGRGVTEVGEVCVRGGVGGGDPASSAYPRCRRGAGCSYWIVTGPLASPSVVRASAETLKPRLHGPAPSLTVSEA